MNLVEDMYDLGRNVSRLAELLEECCKVSRIERNTIGEPAS